MKILISAYECAPNVGSESGVAWNWATQLALSGYEVWVITGEDSRQKIEFALSDGLILPRNLHFAYVDIMPWGVWAEDNQRLIRTHYFIWQFPAYRLAKKLHAAHTFDLVHHLTWGVIRQPSFMGLLGIPFFLGPLGGGETGPFRLVKELPWHIKGFELSRRFLNYLVWIDPFMWLTFGTAKKIYCKTNESLNALPPPFRYKAEKRLEIGCYPAPAKAHEKEPNDGSLKLLFAGRLLHWKGLHIGIRALAGARQRGVECTLTLIGDGPEKKRLQSLAKQLGVFRHIHWSGVLPQNEVFEQYKRHDVLLFPSLHDSSGNAVLEAMTFGLPVICLNLGGPPEITGSQCGIIVQVEGKSIEQVAHDIAEGITDLNEPDKRQKFSAACLERAKDMTWRKVAEQAYRDMEESVLAGAGNEEVL